MAASPIIPNCVEVRLLWIYAGQGAVNVLHAQAPGGFVVNQTTANTLGSAIKGTAWSPFASSQSTQTSLVRVGLRDKRTVGAPEFLDQGAAVVGTETGDALPPQVAACITLRTAGSGKSFRGRVYVGGGGETDNAGAGVMSTGFQTAAINFITAVSAAMTASGLTFCVATRAAELTTIVRTIDHADGSQSVKTLSRSVAKAANTYPVTIIQSRNTSWETQRKRANQRGSIPTLFNSSTEVHLAPA